MKKIFNTLVIFCVAFCTIFCAEQVLAACPQKATEIVTGAACSIKELNLEKSRTAQEKTNLSQTKERDLRPTKLNAKTPAASVDTCFLGTCLYRNLLENELLRGKN